MYIIAFVDCNSVGNYMEAIGFFQHSLKSKSSQISVLTKKSGIIREYPGIDIKAQSVFHIVDRWHGYTEVEIFMSH